VNVRVIPVLAALMLTWVIPSAGQADAPRVTVVKTPQGGIQPQALMDGRGTLHLLYFKGDSAAGDLFYVRREAGQQAFTDPVRVNSQPGSAIAVGTIRGGQLALGKNGRVHVAWNGSGKALPKNPAGHNPMLYARLDDAGRAFEAQRNLMQDSDVLDGGGTIAADAAGNVYVAWHALKSDSPRGASNRQIWLVHSTDEGKTFGAETVANPQPTGACGCCGMRAFVDSKGTARLFYRAATQDIHRDMVLLTATDAGQRFNGIVLDRLTTSICPMSSEAFAEGPGGVFAAWDNDGQVYFARLTPGSANAGKPVAAPGDGQKRKHPALAVNPRGEVLLVWTEGTGWERGGALAWQVYDKAGQPTAKRGRLAGAIPVWGLPAVVAGTDGSFTIFH
jgi:hypothetical protein